MKQGHGLPIFRGIAIGPAVVYRKERSLFPAASEDPATEQKKFNGARETARRQLDAIYRQAVSSYGEQQAAIVDVQRMLLDDLDYLEEVESAIASGASAARAAMECGEQFAAAFSGLEDEYMRARAADIRDVSQRIGDILCGTQRQRIPEGGFLLVTEDLGPSETIQLPKGRVKAFLTRKGSASSHTAILARTMNIPSLVQADLDFETAENCKVLAVDGFTGCWYADPDEGTMAMLLKKQAEAEAERLSLEVYRGKESITKSGRKILLCANIGSPEDAQAALDADAEGVGLMRSEFLFLGRKTPPAEDTLFEAYRKVAQIMGERPVTVRTLDIGADKQVPYINLDQEANPALGLRGIRISLTQDAIFRIHLRAIYRASVYGNLSIMFPMITSLWELRAAKAQCARVRAELSEQGIPVREIPIGIMVETPAAAVQARELAGEAAFFSVGTNDLTQYTLAVDRQNALLGDFYDPYHPALLTLLDYVAKAAQEAGIPAGICGELGADPSLTETFLKMGFTQLSMAPGRILETRRIVCESEV